VIAAYDDGDQPKQVVVCPKIVQPPITVIIGGRALLMLIAARFSAIRLGQRPSEPRDLADRLRPATILQLPDTRRA
jgi:hypothetical protein